MNNVLIICNLFGNNRQGYDLAQVLREEGCRVRLVQYAETSEPEIGNFGVHYIKPHGLFSKFHVLSNLLRIFFRGLMARRDVVVCIGRPLLVDAAVLAALSRAKLVYYSLEYCRYTKIQRWVIQHRVDRLIDVEESRLRAVCQDLGLSIPTTIMYNLPVLSQQPCTRGRLRQYLIAEKGLKGSEKLVLYAGSYQSYACLENIYSASAKFPQDVILVFMVARGLPEGLNKDTEKCKIVQPQSGQTFFDWLADADCSLLPYESEDDFNVRNCSPQKLFDCYRVGVPYLASDCPLIRKINGEYTEAGVFCSFTNVDSIIAGVEEAITLKTPSVSAEMNRLYREKYNYSLHARRLARFILSDNADAEGM